MSATGWSSTINPARTKPLAADHRQWSTHYKSKQRNPISRSKSELRKRQILSKEWGAPQRARRGCYWCRLYARGCDTQANHNSPKSPGGLEGTRRACRNGTFSAAVSTAGVKVRPPPDGCTAFVGFETLRRSALLLARDMPIRDEIYRV